MTIVIKQLPYMGMHKEPAKRTAAQPQEIPFSALREYELEQVESVLQVSTDPYLVLARKVDHLAAILGCSEAKAERILFDRI